jgi:hypothetical protein
MTDTYHNYFSDDPLHYFHRGAIHSSLSQGVAEVVNGKLKGLPDSKRGHVYIVSDEVREAAQALGRTDVVSPGSTIDNPFPGRNETIYSFDGFKR